MGKGSASSSASFWSSAAKPSAAAKQPADIYDLLEKGFISDIPLDCLAPPTKVKEGPVKCYVKRSEKNSFTMYMSGNDRVILRAERSGTSFIIKEAIEGAEARVLGTLVRKDAKDGYRFSSHAAAADGVMSMMSAAHQEGGGMDEMDITHGKRTLKQATVHTMTVRATSNLTRKNDEGCGGAFMLSSKLPRWNERIGSLTLNFHGRAKLASAKNFQLRVGDSETIGVLFGKLNADTFAMDYQSPCSPVQAFALGMCVHEWT